MKNLVTGGTGFVGSAVVRELLRQGQEVRCLVRDPGRPGNLAGVDVEMVQGDITDPASLKSALAGCSRVYHLAGLYAIFLRDPQVMYDVNVKGTRNVLQACLEAGVERVVQTSSHVALGAHGPMPADEGAVFNLGDTGDPYCSSKYQAQQVAQEYAGRGLPVVVVNPTMIAGAGDRGPTPTGQIVLNVMKGAMPAYLDGTTNLVHVEDVAAAQVSAMERGRPGECYLLGGENLTMKALVDLVAATAGGKAPSMRMPVGVAAVLGSGYEMLSRLTGKPPLTTAAWSKLGARHFVWDCGKAVRELGLRQRPARESVADAAEWFRANGYV